MIATQENVTANMKVSTFVKLELLQITLQNFSGEQ